MSTTNEDSCISNDLSVIIAARNAREVLGAQLDALLGQEWSGRWEIVVADNGSTDGTLELVVDYQRRHPRLRTVDASGGHGAGYARNVALRKVTSEAVAFCDADDVVEPGWVAAMGEALRVEACVGGRIRVDGLNPQWLQRAYYSETPDRLETFEEIFPFSATCNLGVRRDLALSLGGFAEDWLTGQDIEFCLRLWLHGVELAYLPEAVIQYRYRLGLRALWRRSREYGAVAPAIAARLVEEGVGRPPRFTGLRQWLWLVRRLPLLRTRAGRARWVVVAGGKVGRLGGSIRARCLLL